MNIIHRWLCSSASWCRSLEQSLLPWALEGVDLGDDLLEIGPGPGLTTDWLRQRSHTRLRSKLLRISRLRDVFQIIACGGRIASVPEIGTPLASGVSIAGVRRSSPLAASTARSSR